MNKRQLARYYDDLQRDEAGEFDRRVREEQAPHARVCGGSKYGRHRFTTRKDASGRLMCDFCTQLRLSDR